MSVYFSHVLLLTTIYQLVLALMLIDILPANIFCFDERRLLKCEIYITSRILSVSEMETQNALILR